MKGAQFIHTGRAGWVQVMLSPAGSRSLCTDLCLIFRLCLTVLESLPGSCYGFRDPGEFPPVYQSAALLQVVFKNSLENCCPCFAKSLENSFSSNFWLSQECLMLVKSNLEPYRVGNSGKCCF